MWEVFRQDAARWITPGQIADPSGLTLWAICKLLYRYMPLRAMAWYRFSCWCKQKKIPFVFGAITRLLYSRFGLEIWGNIGGGLYIAHTVGTVIAVKHMGSNCSVIASVTIGMNKGWAFPEIEEQVFIGAGARVLGEINVGKCAKIGANAVVIQDVPDHATVVGIPARVVQISGEQTLLVSKTNGYLPTAQKMES